MNVLPRDGLTLRQQEESVETKQIARLVGRESACRHFTPDLVREAIQVGHWTIALTPSTT
jgi:hypothetical protein